MTVDSQSSTQPLGIIAASGAIPGVVAEAALAKGRKTQMKERAKRDRPVMV